MSQRGKNKLVAAGTDKVLNDSVLKKRTMLLSSDNGKMSLCFEESICRCSVMGGNVFYGHKMRKLHPEALCLTATVACGLGV